MMRLLSLTCLLAACATADYQKLAYKNCKSTFDVKSVEMSECELFETETSNGCLVKAGSSPKLRITFVPNEAADALETSVRAKFGKSQLPYNLEEANACAHAGLTCPLEAAKQAVYEQTVVIDESYPKDQVFQVNWNVARAGKKDVCIVFHAKIAA